VPPFLIFDLYHTLVHGSDGERDRVVAEMGRTVGVEPEALVRAYNDTWRRRLVEWDVEQTVRALSRRVGGDPSEAAVARAAALRRDFSARVLAGVRPSTLAALDALRAEGCRLALVSNATADTAEAWPGTVLAPRFDVAVFSSDLGVGKPDPRIYLAAAEGLGAPPAGCVYVGDGADGELAGAAALGMAVYRTTEFSDTDPSWPGATIASLTELPAMLRADAHGTADGSADGWQPPAQGRSFYRCEG
jgi:putative hydrolase of the HAD superfamily